MLARPLVEYNGFWIEIIQNPPETLTGDGFWQFKVWRIGNPPPSKENHRKYGGYEVALAQAKAHIDGIITSTDSR